jgi:hypothetical protein
MEGAEYDISARQPVTAIKMNITTPTIHMNGTSYQDLWNGYENAYNAVRAAQDAIRAIEFNSRDYYVQSNQAYSKASDERIEQYTKLNEVEEYLLQHLMAIQEQKND